MEGILNHQRTSGQKFGQIAIMWGLATHQQVWQAWSVQLSAGPRFVDLDEIGVDTAAVERVPAAVARANRIMPLRAWGSNLVVALADPRSGTALDDLPFQTGCEVHHCLADAGQIAEYIQRYYSAVPVG